MLSAMNNSVERYYTAFCVEKPGSKVIPNEINQTATERARVLTKAETYDQAANSFCHTSHILLQKHAICTASVMHIKPQHGLQLTYNVKK